MKPNNLVEFYRLQVQAATLLQRSTRRFLMRAQFLRLKSNLRRHVRTRVDFSIFIGETNDARCAGSAGLVLVGIIQFCVCSFQVFHHHLRLLASQKLTRVSIDSAAPPSHLNSCTKSTQSLKEIYICPVDPSGPRVRCEQVGGGGSSHVTCPGLLRFFECYWCARV